MVCWHPAAHSLNPARVAPCRVCRPDRHHHRGRRVAISRRVHRCVRRARVTPAGRQAGGQAGRQALPLGAAARRQHVTESCEHQLAAIEWH